jgi:ATP-binding cassette subfamily E protein 1
MGKKANSTSLVTDEDEPRRRRAKEDEDQRLRVAIVYEDRCKPSKCNQECKRHCPVNAQGKFCVDVTKQTQSATISESLCIGCGICAKKCPLNALQIINLPSNLTQDTTHRHGPNGFKLHRLPLPRQGRVLGLLGKNGIGKSTSMSILAGRLKPNLGENRNPPDWKNIIKHFRGSELQNYFKDVSEHNLKAAIKVQYVERFADFEQVTTDALVADVLAQKDEKHASAEIAQELDLAHLMNRKLSVLSGGELQRLAIACLCVQKADIYMVDEPSAYLDIRQRCRAAQVIRSALSDTSRIIVVEHDLAVLDYVSDLVCCLWGSPGAYGAVSAPFGSSEGINNFLDGFIPTENLRIREEPLVFRTAKDHDESVVERSHASLYPAMSKVFHEESTEDGKFKLDIDAGSFADSEIIVMLGENGTGKSTFIKILAGKIKCDSEDGEQLEDLAVSCKPQMFTPKYQGTVRQLLLEKIQNSILDPQFQSDVVKPMQVDKMMDFEVQTLSGGQLQSLALVLTLGKPADMYLIDEPSAYLDVEQRVAASRVIRRFILNQRKTAFVVEHDLIMATYLADRVIVFDGQPGVQCHASSPCGIVEGLNKFLSQLHITIRSGRNGRPRINRVGSARDSEQKKNGLFFSCDGY